ncbi:(d)CMP kinase [Arenicella sp. 4NH20-0111]|uniref:(d)CMP kinase n=1 Tax=Arenicella sp. 4NH20-0111 TaxID=3127648 RepID=UPI00310B45D9
MSVPVLALDGPSGSGKGTIGQKIAATLEWHYLDSGAIYRGLAWLAKSEGVRSDDIVSLVQLADSMELVCHIQSNDSAQIEINGEIITDALRTDEAGQLASEIAPIVQVRAALLQMQRRCRKSPGLVADGRDMGTTVFPDADFKVYLTASAEIRAKRRYDQLKSKGFDVNLARLLESIQSRDVRDSSREESPLKPADGATILDTSDLSIDEVVTRIMDLID